MSRNTPSSDTSKKNVDDQTTFARDRLDPLPQKHREEIMKQYDLPDVKVSLIKLLRYGTPLDVILQILGSVMAVGAGPTSPLHNSDFRGFVASHDDINWQYDESLWRNIIPSSTRCYPSGCELLQPAGSTTNPYPRLHRNFGVFCDILGDCLLDHLRGEDQSPY